MNILKFATLALSLTFLMACSRETCQDGELNQNENSVDCGGVCSFCPTCFDGIVNGAEILTDCGGDCQPCKIEFPTSGNYGTNLLQHDITNTTAGTYSLHAEVLEGSHFQLTMVLIEGTPWTLTAGTESNLIISNQSEVYGQELRPVEPGIMDVEIVLSGSGSARLIYAENKTTHFSKTIAW
jgi:hypothetical protein